MNECCETCRFYHQLKIYKRIITQTDVFRLEIGQATNTYDEEPHCCTRFNNDNGPIYETRPDDKCEGWREKPSSNIMFVDSEFEMAKAFSELKRNMQDMIDGKFTNGDSARNLEDNAQLALLLWNMPKFDNIDQLREWLDREYVYKD